MQVLSLALVTCSSPTTVVDSTRLCCVQRYFVRKSPPYGSQMSKASQVLCTPGMGVGVNQISDYDLVMKGNENHPAQTLGDMMFG